MPDMAMAAFAGEVLELYAPPAMARATWVKMRQVLKEFAAVEGVATVADLRALTVQRWVNAQLAAGRGPNTVRGLLSYLRAAASYAVDEGYLDSTPFGRRRRYLQGRPARKPRHHPAADVAKVLAHLAGRSAEGWDAGRLHALVATLAYAGLRRHEALYLQAGDVDFAAGILWVDPTRRRLKTEASAAPVPCPDVLLSVLRVWLPRSGSAWVFPGVRRAGPWTGGMPGRKPLDRVKAAGLAVGVAGLTCHSLRHSLATHLAGRLGLTARQLQLVLRHASATTQAHYLGDDVANLRGLVRGFDFAGGPGRATRADPGHVLPRRRPGRRPRRT